MDDQTPDDTIEDEAAVDGPAPELEPLPPPTRVGRGSRACRLTYEECDYLDRLEGK